MYLQMFGAVLIPVRIDGRQEDALHLIVSPLIRRLVGRNQHLPGSQRHLVVNKTAIQHTRAERRQYHESYPLHQPCCCWRD